MLEFWIVYALANVVGLFKRGKWSEWSASCSSVFEEREREFMHVHETQFKGCYEVQSRRGELHRPARSNTWPVDVDVM
jgi:hypothetical protein